MGQFVDYVASFWPSSKNELSGSKSGQLMSPHGKSHVTFADSSFSFGRHEGEKAARLAAISFANQRTINTFIAIGTLAFLSHIFWVVYPTWTSEDFDLRELNNYHKFSVECLTPLIVYLASFSAMNQVNKPLSEGAKLSSKNSGLELNNNPFITSIKIIVVLTAICQISSIYCEQATWLLLIIIPVWCYKLVSNIAQSEYQRYSVSPKKQWTDRLNIVKSPGKNKTPQKEKQTKTSSNQTPSKKTNDDNTQQTPRVTRTKRVVKNLINDVSEKYHAFEQNVSQQLSQGIFNQRTKAIEN